MSPSLKTLLRKTIKFSKLVKDLIPRTVCCNNPIYLCLKIEQKKLDTYYYLDTEKPWPELCFKY